MAFFRFAPDAVSSTQPGWPIARVDMLVVGAGVVGVSTAYALARRGYSVAIVDRAEGAGLATSFANGAQLSYAYTDALGSPAMLRKLPSLALGRDPFFRLGGRIDPELIGWGLRFLRNCTADRFSKNTLAVLKLALESQAAMHALLKRHPIDFAHTMPGKMHLYYDRAALAAAAQVMDLKRAHGVEQRVLSAAEAIAIEPALEGARGLAGVIYSPRDAVGDPSRFTNGLLRVVREEYEVRSFFGFDLNRIHVQGDGVVARDLRGREIAARRIVLCTGADAPRLARGMGVRVPVLPMKGYSFTAPTGKMAPRVSITDTARKLVFCELDGQMRVAGLAELGARDASIDPERMGALVGFARESLPDAAEYDAIASRWAGLRPMTPSSAPIIARPSASLILNVGHGMLGWTLAMGAAERAAELAQIDLKPAKTGD